MFERVAFKRGHLDEMLKQPKNESAAIFFSTINFDVVEKLPSFTGVLHGRPVVCGGIVPYWTGRGYLWTVFDETTKDCFIPIFRGIKAFLNEFRPMYNRLEVAVPCEFKVGMRRARLLGFTPEVERAERFLPDGGACSLFVLLGGP